MKLDRNIRFVYLASINPMHYSHLNTWTEARKQLGREVYLCICQNNLKSTGLFSLEERKNIARKYYKIPENLIVILPNKRRYKKWIGLI